MAPITSRRISQENENQARRAIVRHRRRDRLLNLSLSKLAESEKRGCINLRVQVLVKNAYIHLKNSGDLLSTVAEGLQQEPGGGPDPHVASPRPSAEELPSLASAALGYNPEEAAAAATVATRNWDTVPQEGLLCDPLFGGFEIQAATCPPNLPTDIFTDIDLSEFNTIPAPLPSGGQPSQGYTSQLMEVDPQPKAVHLPDQADNGLAQLEHFVDLLIDADKRHSTRWIPQTSYVPTYSSSLGGREGGWGRNKHSY